MEKETLYKYIKYFQCKLATKYAKTWNKNLIKGKCVEETFEDIIVANYLIDILYNYNYLDGTVTNAWSFTIERVEEGSLTISVVIDGDTIVTYTGDGDTATILADLLTSLHADYEGFIDGTTLYIYSFAVTEDFTDIPTITQSVADLVNITATNLYGNLDILTDRWNCLTYDQLCVIKKHLMSIL